jgi:hypothetical protein
MLPATRSFKLSGSRFVTEASMDAIVVYESMYGNTRAIG